VILPLVEWSGARCCESGNRLDEGAGRHASAHDEADDGPRPVKSSLYNQRQTDCNNTVARVKCTGGL
jgi:hypothetical protein